MANSDQIADLAKALNQRQSQIPLGGLKAATAPIWGGLAGIASEAQGDESGPAGTAQLAHPKEEEASAKASEAKQATAAKTKQQTAAKESEIKAVQDSPWTQLSNALTKEYAQAETPTAALVSGSEGNQAEAGAANQALASLGLSSSSPAGSWLSAQTQAAQATAAPVSQAMAQEGAQYAAEAKPIESALAAGGQANAQAVQVAPEDSWVTALASHVQSNLNYYGGVAPSQVPELEQNPALVSAFQQAGGGSGGSGLTPVTSFKVKNGTVSAPPSSQAAFGSAGAYGQVPGAGTTPGS